MARKLNHGPSEYCMLNSRLVRLSPLMSERGGTEQALDTVDGAGPD